MGYPQNALADGEQLVLHRHPHVKRLILPVLALLVATAVAGFTAGLVNSRDWDPNAENIVFGVIWAIWLVIVGWLTLWPFVDWLTTHFVITDRRVMYRCGVLGRGGIDIPLARITSIEFAHRLSERLFRTGTLIIGSAPAEPVEFYDVPRVQQVHALLYQEVFDNPSVAW